KYKKQEDIGAFFGDWYGSLIKEENTLHHIDAVVPVPLHPKKEKKRTYNQVSLFAKQIAEHLQVDFAPELLVRTKTPRPKPKKTASYDGKTFKMLLNPMHPKTRSTNTYYWLMM
ncbi:MAG: hypothetical protein AAFY00_10350, partial [Bacteroidota bacterium]